MLLDSKDPETNEDLRCLHGGTIHMSISLPFQFISDKMPRMLKPGFESQS